MKDMKGLSGNHLLFLMSVLSNSVSLPIARGEKVVRVRFVF
jgi:hypothetical protein